MRDVAKFPVHGMSVRPRPCQPATLNAHNLRSMAHADSACVADNLSQCLKGYISFEEEVSHY